MLNLDPCEISLFYPFFFCFISGSRRSCSPTKPSRHHGYVFQRPTDLQPQAHRLNKFRNLCCTSFFCFFPKLLSSISRKKIIHGDLGLSITSRYFIAYLIPIPIISALVRRVRGPEYQEFLDIFSWQFWPNLSKTRVLIFDSWQVWVNCQAKVWCEARFFLTFVRFVRLR